MRYFILFSILLLNGCGFQLRAKFAIPPMLKHLKVSPQREFYALRTHLIQLLKNNGVNIVESEESAPSTQTATLTILTVDLKENTLAYGNDGQINFTIIQLTVRYQIQDPQNQFILTPKTIQLEKTLPVFFNNILSTDNERQQLHMSLYQDAAAQIIRELNGIPHAHSK